jgi:hypothetical protein
MGSVNALLAIWAKIVQAALLFALAIALDAGIAILLRNVYVTKASLALLAKR